jgi:hypothetical protein
MTVPSRSAKFNSERDNSDGTLDIASALYYVVAQYGYGVGCTTHMG